jgi:hypothetical protein
MKKLLRFDYILCNMKWGARSSRVQIYKGLIYEKQCNTGGGDWDDEDAILVLHS